MTTTIEDNFRFDTRIRERMLDKGQITAEELEKRLGALTDVESEAVAIELEQPAVSSRREEGAGQ